MPRPESDRLPLEHSVSLATRTTLQLGGPAQFYATAHDEEGLLRLLEWAKTRELPARLLGGGSNVVVADEGVDGLVIQNALRGVSIEKRASSDVEMTVAAGEPWDDVVARAVSADLAGIECLSGIPGLSGATPVQNVGAYGQEISQCLRRLRVFDRDTSMTHELDAADCQFGYRDSVFKQHPGRWVVLELTLTLSTGIPAIPCYGELTRTLAEIRSPSVASIRAKVLELRRRKSMVIDPANPHSQSAGSFFMNPVVTEAQRTIITDEAGMAPPSFPTASGFKVPAGWLIEQAGFVRGTRRGPVGLSPDHALAIVHYGGGTTRALLALAAEIRRGVNDRFGVLLEPEPVLWGTEWPWRIDG